MCVYLRQIKTAINQGKFMLLQRSMLTAAVVSSKFNIFNLSFSKQDQPLTPETCTRKPLSSASRLMYFPSRGCSCLLEMGNTIVHYTGSFGVFLQLSKPISGDDSSRLFSFNSNPLY